MRWLSNSGDTKRISTHTWILIEFFLIQYISMYYKIWLYITVPWLSVTDEKIGVFINPGFWSTFGLSNKDQFIHFITYFFLFIHGEIRLIDLVRMWRPFHGHLENKSVILFSEMEKLLVWNIFFGAFLFINLRNK